MPISRRVFESPEDAVPQLVLELLRANADLALTSAEVVSALAEQGLALPDGTVLEALSDLVTRQRVAAQELFGSTYYSYRSGIGFRGSGGR